MATRRKPTAAKAAQAAKAAEADTTAVDAAVAKAKSAAEADPNQPQQAVVDQKAAVAHAERSADVMVQDGAEGLIAAADVDGEVIAEMSATVDGKRYQFQSRPLQGAADLLERQLLPALGSDTTPSRLVLTVKAYK